jgi:acetyltransferase-like isoleucine patch superfamily enzyme
MNSFYSMDELQNFGFKSVGNNVKISKFARFYDINKISIGNNVRIDDCCVLSGNITLYSNIHIACFCALFGSAGIVMEDFSGLSSRVSIYSCSDDYVGNAMTGPQVPIEFRILEEKTVILKKHGLVGSGALILPGGSINEGSVLGAMSVLKKPTEPWTIYGGVPAKKIKERKSDVILSMEQKII